jgi:polyhydroxybutyrate depolymerase
MSIIAFHGGADAVDPFAGHGQLYWTYSVPDAARMWAAQDGCSAAPAQSQPILGVTLTAYKKCDAGAQVELYEIAPLGHEWPGGPAMPNRITRLLGPQSNLVDANQVMWAFFSTHPLTQAG